MSRFVVVSGGPSTDVELSAPDPSATVIAADSGGDRVRVAGWPVHHLVGDLDSISPAGLAYCDQLGASVHRHRADKDATDLELALDLAMAEGATEIEVILDTGGRLDHLLVAAHVLADSAYSDAEVVARAGATTVSVVRGVRTLGGAVHELLSLLPVGGPARVRTAGLVYPLADEWLEPTSGRGLSNRLSRANPLIDVTDGVVLVIQPGGG